MKFFLISLIGIGLIIVLIPHLVYIIIKLLAWAFHFKVNYKPYGIASAGMLAIWLIMAVYGNLWGRFFYETKEHHLTFATLPKSFNGYRLVHISDLHLDGWVGHEEKMQEIVDSINSLDPDIIVFTGDIVSLDESELKPFVPILSKLKAKDGIYSILGNHDYLPYNRSWDEKERHEHVQNLISMEKNDLHWHLLLNEHAVIHHETDSIAILGSENQSMGVHRVVTRGNLPKTCEDTEQMFRILLTHDPTHWRGEVLPYVSSNGHTNIPLTLSGHTHGGQVKLFGKTFSSFIYSEDAGFYHSDDGKQTLYISTGLGGTMPMRVGLPAEINLFIFS